MHETRRVTINDVEGKVAMTLTRVDPGTTDDEVVVKVRVHTLLRRPITLEELGLALAALRPDASFRG